VPWRARGFSRRRQVFEHEIFLGVFGLTTKTSTATQAKGERACLPTGRGEPLGVAVPGPAPAVRRGDLCSSVVPDAFLAVESLHRSVAGPGRAMPSANGNHPCIYGTTVRICMDDTEATRARAPIGGRILWRPAHSTARRHHSRFPLRAACDAVHSR